MYVTDRSNPCRYVCVYIRTYIYIYTQKGVKHLLLLNIDNFPVDIANIEWIIAFLENANFQFVIYTKKNPIILLGSIYT